MNILKLFELLVGPSGLEPPIKILSLRIRFGKSRFRFLIVFVSYLVLLVGPSGLEPPTSCLSGTRSNLLSYEPMWLVSDYSHYLSWGLTSGGDDGIRFSRELRARSSTVANVHRKFALYRFPFESADSVTDFLQYLLLGGDDGIRTHDPLLAGQVLSQLSYTPITWVFAYLRSNSKYLFTIHYYFLLQLWEAFTSHADVGIELSSRTVSRKVLSPLQSLTSVFGMGTGGPSAFVTPTNIFLKNLRSLKIEQQFPS